MFNRNSSASVVNRSIDLSVDVNHESGQIFTIDKSIYHIRTRNVLHEDYPLVSLILYKNIPPLLTDA
jgi:hypothetical protein